MYWHVLVYFEIHTITYHSIHLCNWCVFSNLACNQVLISYTVHHACNWYVILQGVDVITYHYTQIPTLKTGDEHLTVTRAENFFLKTIEYFEKRTEINLVSQQLLRLVKLDSAQRNSSQTL